MESIIPINTSEKLRHKPSRDRLRNFVETEIIPQEMILAQQNEEALSVLANLQQKAKQQDLFGSFYPSEFGGHFTRLKDYLLIAEEEGRSEYAPFIFGSESTVDIHMLAKYGKDSVKKNFLKSLASGNTVASYAMTEPETCGSVPDTLKATAELKNGYWHINAHKWFICRADQAQFVAVVVCTAPEQPVKSRLSIILVPTDTHGFQILENIKIFNQHHGQCELKFDNVKVPEHFLLGTKGNGLAMIGQRLKFGRILRSTHWLGLAQRCFDLMCLRVNSERGRQLNLADKQLVRQHAVEVYQSLAHTRALIHSAANELDNHLSADQAVNLAKLSASKTLCLAVDCAIQIYGAEGVSERTPLASIYQMARANRILDGADEALISSIGKQLLAPNKQHNNNTIPPIYFHESQSNE